MQERTVKISPEYKAFFGLFRVVEQILNILLEGSATDSEQRAVIDVDKHF